MLSDSASPSDYGASGSAGAGTAASSSSSSSSSSGAGGEHTTLMVGSSSGSGPASTRRTAKYALYISMALLSFGFLFQVIGMSTLGWIVGDTYSIGLTTAEQNSGGIVYEVELDAADASAGSSVLGTGIIAILLGTAALIAASAKSWGWHVAHYKIATRAGCFLSAILIFVGAILYASKSDFTSDSNEHFGYSFGLFIAAGVFNLIAGIIMTVILRYDDSN